ncbi:MAG: D-amino-acid transaminase [Nitrospirae bacterium]|nr:D-amino-acid transaminase [Nitrospirota bacterium]
MPDIAFVNGRFMPLSEATVNVEDRGYQFGDGVYEVIRSYNSILFGLEDHLVRLERSANQIQLDMGYSKDEWKKIILEAFKKSGYNEAKVYIQITRGVAPRAHPFPSGVNPTCVITVRELDRLSEEVRREGVKAITTPDIRWGRCDIKSLNLLPNVLARQKAKEAGAFEAVFVRDNMTTEGSGSNIFIVKNGSVITPSQGPYILSGITREVVIEAAKEAGIIVEERGFPVNDLFLSDEVFITGSTIEVVPVVEIDNRLIGDGIPGKITGIIIDQFRSLTRSDKS